MLALQLSLSAHSSMPLHLASCAPFFIHIVVQEDQANFWQPEGDMEEDSDAEMDSDAGGEEPSISGRNSEQGDGAAQSSDDEMEEIAAEQKVQRSANRNGHGKPVAHVAPAPQGSSQGPKAKKRNVHKPSAAKKQRKA